MVHNNFLIPKHRKLDEKEVTSLLKKYKISKQELPIIKLSDPALSDLNVEVGDVVEIERKSFAGKTKYYRVIEE